VGGEGCRLLEREYACSKGLAAAAAAVRSQSGQPCSSGESSCWCWLCECGVCLQHHGWWWLGWQGTNSVVMQQAGDPNNRVDFMCATCNNLPLTVS